MADHKLAGKQPENPLGEASVLKPERSSRRRGKGSKAATQGALDMLGKPVISTAAQTSTRASHRDDPNRQVPIHRLPFDVMDIIFDILLFASSGRRLRLYVAGLTILRSVSSMWRDMIDQTPRFWTQLSSKDPIGFISDALQKSQRHGLHLKYAGKLADKITNGEFWAQVSSHSDRWEHVVLQEPHGNLIRKYFSAPVPRLKGLVLWLRMGYVAYGPDPPSLLFGGKWESLEELRVVSWKQMSWTEVRCHNLRVLTIEDSFWFDMELLFGIIAENSHSLTILRLHFITFCPYTHSQGTHQPIELCNLKEFTFTSMAEVVSEGNSQKTRDVPVMRMVRRVRIPSCTLFAIEITLDENPEATREEFFHLIPRPVDIFARNSKNSQRSQPKPPSARVTFWANELTGEAFGHSVSKPLYSLLVRNFSRELSGEWVKKELVDGWSGEGATRKPDLELRYWVDDELPMEDMFELEDLDTVTGLEVMGHEDAGWPVAPGLALRLQSPGASGALPFPRLNHLTLSHCAVSAKEVLKMVQARFGPTRRKGEKQRNRDVDRNGARLTVTLSKGMEQWPKSTVKGIQATPGVKVVKKGDTLEKADDDASSSSSSEESDWDPRYPEGSDSDE
ncbi:hypothetical protein FRB90_011196 [Tulasnella sp. 427]|nr:hypothetical protein FRB90_011196 [Tulasnella sp. 427]